MTASIASSPASDSRPNEDFAAATATTAVLLDGAGSGSLDTGCSHGVAWFAHQLGHQLFIRLNQPRVLAEILSDAIEVTARSHAPTCDLLNPATPSATVLMLRADGDSIEHLVLADSVLALSMADGTVETITDKREAYVGAKLHGEMDRTPNGSNEHEAALNEYLSAMLAHRNTAGGFWVAAADPLAAAQAIMGRTSITRLQAAALLSDGASRLADRFHLATWAELMDIVLQHGPAELIRRVRHAEATDPHGDRWPRGKASDDATAVLFKFP